ncbi:hypothetical protein BU17DRAFT_71843 [Hysterangium stoloniferum]|nr:hypothetical protein BU17DRAFT_71843 [Hysterangium stoloniferum]
MSRSHSLPSASSGSQASSPPQSPIYPTTPPPHSNHPYVPHSKELSLMRIPDITSSTLLPRPPSFPIPPTGHDLMLMFPSPPPPPAEYTGTSAWFGREEREFFKEGNYAADVGRELYDSSERRRRSLSEEDQHMHLLAPPPPPPPSQSPHPQPCPQPQPQPIPTPQQQQQQQQPPPQLPHGTRRRAGKYTKRVFVSNPPVYPPHPSAPFPPSEMPPPPQQPGYPYPQATPQSQTPHAQAWGR